jgi:curved DNA-binding protein CbpA
MGVMMTKDYYAILGIKPDTDQSLIKTAAQAQANEINEAFRVLNDPETRAAYDAIWQQHYAQDKGISSPNQSVVMPSSSAPIMGAYGEHNPPRSSVAFATHSKKSLRENHNTIFSQLAAKVRIQAPNSIREILILLLAVVFFVYVASGFFVPLHERQDVGNNLNFKRLSQQGPQ